MKHLIWGIVLDLSCDTISPTPWDGTQTFLPRRSLSKRHAETHNGTCFGQSSCKKQYKLTNQSPKNVSQQINVQTPTQADDGTLLNVIESADLNHDVQLLKGNNHFSPHGLDRALISACRHVLKHLVQELVYLGPNVQFKDTLRNTSLLICAANVLFYNVFLLQKRKADVNSSNLSEDNALILSKAELLKIVRIILDQNGVYFSHQNWDRLTDLMKSVEVRDVDVIKLLMDTYKKEEVDGTTSGQVSKPCCLKSKEAVEFKEMTSQENADNYGLQTHAHTGVSLLDTAIETRDTELVNLLLSYHFVGKQDVQASFINIFKNVQLNEVQLFTDKEIMIIKKLLKYGAEVDAGVYSGPSPLSVAVKMGDYVLVELLCQHLDQRQQSSFQCGQRALIEAAKSGRCDLIKLLLHHKADINNDYYYCGSPLDCALSHGHLKCAKLLVQHGASMDIESAHHSAVKQQLPEYINFIRDNYQLEIISNDAIVCTILGLSEDVRTWLSELDPKLRAHQPLLYFIRKAIDAVTEEKRMNDTTHGKHYLLNSLQSLRFTWHTVCWNIPPDTVDLQTPAFWAKRYLDYTYTYHPLLKSCPRYPYCADIIDERFMVDITQQGSGEDTDKHVQVPIINLSNDSIGDTPVAANLLQQQLVPEKGYQLLFHGTTHQSAVSIITDGIILTEGEKKQDFSSGDGFYLSENFENASVWRRACRKVHQAVIVYKIEQTLLDAENQNGLDLAQNKSQWEEVVICCRNGYKDKRYKRRLDGVTFIRGPMCRNPQDLGGRGIRPSGFGRGVMQLCIRNEEYAQTFGNLENIRCVVFY